MKAVNTVTCLPAVRDGVCILLASVLYAIGTVWFIFPHGLFLGGTSGISVILTAFLKASPGVLLFIINMALLALAFLLLGRRIAFKTLLGSSATAVCIALVERYLTPAEPLIPSLLLSATVGALILAVAGGVLFFVGSSSGGTDIVALIVQRFSRIRNIGRALFVTDVLIVLVGGILTNVPMLLCSLLGLFLKTLGIDVLVALLARLLLLAAKRRAAREENKKI